MTQWPLKFAWCPRLPSLSLKNIVGLCLRWYDYTAHSEQSMALGRKGGEFITSGNWRGKHNSLSRGPGAD